MEKVALIDDESWKNIQDSVNFYKQHGQRILELLLQGPQRVLPQSFLLRGMLSDNVYGNGQGTVNLIERSTLANSFWVTILGINPPIKPSHYRLKLVGLSAHATETVLYTGELEFDLTPDEVKDELIRASLRGPFPLNDDKVSVLLGQPAGRYTVAFTPEILDTYVGGILLTAPVDDIVLHGQTVLVVSATKDIVTTNTETVFDIYNRPVDNPWQGGQVVTCAQFLDVGYGIITSDYRDVTVASS